MARLTAMPPLAFDRKELAAFGTQWTANGQSLSRTPPYSSGQLGTFFDRAVGQALATMLGGIPVVAPSANALTPPQPDCVEVGPVRIIGGVRPQNFDVGYRPDGVRFAFDSKTLNDRRSIGKNWQNMINDLATEATTVHSRFPHAVVAFLVALPAPVVDPAQRSAIIETLERLARRTGVDGPDYMAEAIALVLWNPADGSIDQTLPAPPTPTNPGSSLRYERFSEQVEAAYVSRYKGLPPHAVG
jgi:hypothetical protein